MHFLYAGLILLVCVAFYQGAQTENLLIELVGKPLRPCCIVLAEVAVKYLLQGFPIPDFLIAGGFINQGCNTDDCEALSKDSALFRDVGLLVRQEASADSDDAN